MNDVLEILFCPAHGVLRFLPALLNVALGALTVWFWSRSRT